MRGLVALALLASMGLAAIFVLGPPEAADMSSPSEVANDLRTTLSTLRGNEGDSPPSVSNSQPASTPTPVFYKYTDDQGRTHFVQTAGDIPDRYRKKAGTVEIRNEIIRPAEPTVARTPRPRVRARQPVVEERRRMPRADVVVYTTPWCGWCRKTIAWLDEAGVDYENRDIEANPVFRAELLAKTGATSIPMVEIDGQVVRGFSPGRMSELLEL
jgi:glutaredoxin